MTALACLTCSRWLHDDEQTGCRLCASTVVAWLTELPAQLVVLRGSRERESGNGQRVSVSRTAPTPGRLDVLNLLGPAAPVGALDSDDNTGDLPIHETLYQEARRVRRGRHLQGPGSNSAEALAAWLTPHIPWSADQDWWPDMHHALQQMVSAVRSITRVRPRTRPVDRPCPRCDSLALIERDHQPYIECSCCDSLFTLADLALDAHLRLARRQHQAAA